MDNEIPGIRESDYLPAKKKKSWGGGMVQVKEILWQAASNMDLNMFPCFTR